MVTDYNDNDNDLDNTQIIRREPIPEANNTVYWDPDAKLPDKSDAKYCVILTPYTQQGFEDLLEELGVEVEDVVSSSFAEPENDYVYPWSYGNTTEYIHVGEYYEVRQKRERVNIYLTTDGDTVAFTDKQIEETPEKPEDAGAVR